MTPISLSLVCSRFGRCPGDCSHVCDVRVRHAVRQTECVHCILVHTQSVRAGLRADVLARDWSTGAGPDLSLVSDWSTDSVYSGQVDDRQQEQGGDYSEES